MSEKIEPIKEIVDFLDEDFNPVDEEKDARYINTIRFGENNEVESTELEVIV